MECSGHGSCNELSGECVCNAGFDGFDCSRLKCPEVYDNNLKKNVVCNNRGKCLNGEDYAEHFITVSELNVENPTFSSPVTESVIPDNTDIYGCLCDSGFSGYDCSEVNCPVGGVENKGNYRKAVIEPNNGDNLIAGESITIRIANCNGNKICRFSDIILSKSLRENDIRNLIRTSGVIQDVVVKLYNSGVTIPPTADPFDIETNKALQLNEAKYMVLYFVTDNNAYVAEYPSSSPSYSVTHSFVTVYVNADDKPYEKNTPTIGYADLVVNKVCSGIGTCNKDKGVCECKVSKTNYDNYNGLLGDIKILNCQLKHQAIVDNKDKIDKLLECKNNANKVGCNNDYDNCQPYCKCPSNPQNPTDYEGINCDEVISDGSTKWFGLSDNVVCSNMGKIKNGKCVCADGFNEDAKYGDTFLKDCNGNGKLNKNEIITGKLEYSECECFKNYRGSNCSEEYCVFGLDPYDKLEGDNLDSPKITFTRVGTPSFPAEFNIKVNGTSHKIKITDGISCDEVKTEFKKIQFLKDGIIDCTGGSLTNTADSTITLTFESCCNEDFDVESSPAGSTNTITITFTEGKRKCYECSNRGICDRSKRVCKCEKYFLSSGGYNSLKKEIVIGIRGDCSFYDSYRKPIDKEEEEI